MSLVVKGSLTSYETHQSHSWWDWWVSYNNKKQWLIFTFFLYLIRGDTKSRLGVVSGFRGAALNQSRSASGVYTGLLYWHGCEYQWSASSGRRKMQQRSVSRICDTGYIPLPRSLTRCARSFGCGERCLLSQNQKSSDHTIRWLILFGSFTEKPWIAF